MDRDERATGNGNGDGRPVASLWGSRDRPVGHLVLCSGRR